MKDEKTPAENEAVQLHTILPPDEPEQPEEGFVPYCAEATQIGGGRTRIKTVILIILSALFILMLVFILAARHNNFFRKTVNSLSFDYRNGEAADEISSDDPGQYSRRLSEQMNGNQFTADANVYTFDEKGGMFAEISNYNYTKNSAEQILQVRSGTEKSVFTDCLTLRSNGSLTERKKGSNWVQTTDEYIPPLCDYFFETQSHGNILLNCHDAFDTIIGSTNYHCEIWLMQEGTDSNAVYFTLYRYFDGSKLAGVRVLASTDTLMDVYDIQSYSFS